MNIIFCHISTFNLQYFHKQTVLFDNFMKSSYFEMALSSYIEASKVDKIFLIFPENDYNFIDKQINNLKINSSKVVLFPVSDSNSYAFIEQNILFNPMKMSNILTFGAWNFKFIESQAKKITLTKFIILNMEDFWFLNPSDLNNIFDITNTSNITFHNKNGGYHLLAGSFKEAKINYAKNSHSKKRAIKQLKENFNNLTSVSKLDAHSKINLRRQENLDTHIQFAPDPTDIINKEIKPYNNISILISKIFKNPLALSLSYNSGINTLQKINKLTNIPPVFNNDETNKKLFLSKPKIMRIQLKDHNTSISLQDFKSAIDILPEINFIILEDYNQFKEETLENIVQYATINLTSHIYLESSCSNLNDDKLNKLFLKGVTVFIIDIDQFLLKKSQLELEKKIESFLKIRDKYHNKYIMLKKKNILDDSDHIPLLIHKWQYIVDGIMITRSENLDEAYQVDTNQKLCSIIPYEIYLKNNAKFSLCSNMPEKEFSLTDYDSWLKETRLTPYLSQCQNCLDKHKYIYSCTFNPSKESIKQYLSILQIKNHLDLIKIQINKKDYSKALTYIEHILKIDPTNKSGWKFLSLIEKDSKG